MAEHTDAGTDTADANRIVAAALAVAAETGWSAMTLADVAARAGVDLTVVSRHFGSKPAILDGLSRMTDAAMLAGGPTDPADPPRDRLFDAIMRRFDVLSAHRAGVVAVLKALGRDPILAASRLPGLTRSMRWTLELADLPPQGALGEIRIRGLGLLYLVVLRDWVGDDSADLAKTMAALDKRLNQAEQIAGMLERGGRWKAPEAGPSEGAEP